MSLAGNVYESGPVRLEFLRTGEETDGTLHEMRATYAPGSPLPPAHIHPSQDERFEVLGGELTFVVEGVERVVAAGESIEVSRGQVHQVRNAGALPATALWQTRPALRTAAFHDAIHRATAAEDWSSLRATLEDHRDVFVMVPDPFADG